MLLTFDDVDVAAVCGREAEDVFDDVESVVIVSLTVLISLDSLSRRSTISDLLLAAMLDAQEDTEDLKTRAMKEIFTPPHI